jgi:hypothetical protein
MTRLMGEEFTYIKMVHPTQENGSKISSTSTGLRNGLTALNTKEATKWE